MSRFCVIILCLFSSPSWSEDASYDAQSSELSIPCVEVSGSYFSAVLHYSENILTLIEASEVSDATTSCSFYDTSLMKVYIPVADVAGQKFWAIMKRVSDSPLQFSLDDIGPVLTQPEEDMSTSDESCYNNFKQLIAVKLSPDALSPMILLLDDTNNSYCQAAISYLYTRYSDSNIDGYNKTESLKLAYDYAARSAVQGNPLGQLMLADMYYVGSVVDPEFGIAYMLWTMSARQMWLDSLITLGELYREGNGVAQNFKMAFYWLELAATMGGSRSQAIIGEMYYFGEGVAPSVSSAVQWWQLAAEQDDPYAQNNLAWLYEKGIGVVQNLILSCQLYTQAVNNGLTASTEARDRVCP